jgi:hypothetical protein
LDLFEALYDTYHPPQVPLRSTRRLSMVEPLRGS